jgi:hypothetical protein
MIPYYDYLYEFVSIFVLIGLLLLFPVTIVLSLIYLVIGIKNKNRVLILAFLMTILGIIICFYSPDELNRENITQQIIDREYCINPGVKSGDKILGGLSVYIPKGGTTESIRFSSEPFCLIVSCDEGKSHNEFYCSPNIQVPTKEFTE